MVKTRLENMVARMHSLQTVNSQLNASVEVSLDQF